MDHSLKVGLSFGLTSGIITTLGLMVGLAAGTQSEVAVLGGIITIAIADAFSDGFGIHISEESEGKHTSREIWVSTLATFASKFVCAMSFVVPLLLFDLTTALVVSVMWGAAILTVLSYRLAREQRAPAWKVVGEHLGIAAVVIVLTHYVGAWVGAVFR